MDSYKELEEGIQYLDYETDGKSYLIPPKLYDQKSKEWYNNPKYFYHSTLQKVKPTGGPASYFDFQEGWNTLNDIMEYKAEHQWKEHTWHLGNIFKACFRWGEKEGTTKGYDLRKIIYSALRVLMKMEGKEAMRKYLEEDILKDKQFV